MLLCHAGYESRKHDRMVRGVMRLKDLTIHKAIVGLAKGYRRLYGLASVRDINDGMCEDFAHDLRVLIPGVEPTWDDELRGGDGSHCFAVYCGRYYDSETPEGVDDWRDLPFWLRW